MFRADRSRPTARRYATHVPGTPFPTGPKSHGAVERANEELAGLVALLESHGVKVRRPKPYDFSGSVTTPDFSIENQYCAVCPRDVMITVGNEIIEAPMSRRARYFEYRAYRELVYEYWKADPSVGWTSAPKPSMRDDMYREDFWDWPVEKRHSEMHAFEFCVSQERGRLRRGRHQQIRSRPDRPGINDDQSDRNYLAQAASRTKRIPGASCALSSRFLSLTH